MTGNKYQYQYNACIINAVKSYKEINVIRMYLYGTEYVH